MRGSVPCLSIVSSLISGFVAPFVASLLVWIIPIVSSLHSPFAPPGSVIRSANVRMNAKTRGFLFVKGGAVKASLPPSVSVTTTARLRIVRVVLRAAVPLFASLPTIVLILHVRPASKVAVFPAGRIAIVCPPTLAIKGSVFPKCHRLAQQTQIAKSRPFLQVGASKVAACILKKWISSVKEEIHFLD